MSATAPASCLVTGGAGFIGSHLVDRLLSDGHSVTILDNFSTGREENLVQWKGSKMLTIVRGDVCNFSDVRKVCHNKDWVFHLAAMSRIQPSIANPPEAVMQNCIGTANLLEACRQAGVKRVVYSASSSSYGTKNAALLSSGSSRALSEDLPSSCDSPYALSKKFGEDLTLLYCQLYGMSTVVLKYFNVYGPRQISSGAYSTVLGVFLQQWLENKPFTVFGDGTQRRDYTHVFDIVRANLLAACSPNVRGMTINIGCGRNYSVLEVAQLIDPAHSIQFLPARLGEYPLTLADNTRARDLLGWSPQIHLAQGVDLLKQQTTNK